MLVTVMPKSLISLTVASGDPLRCYFFGGNFLPRDIQDLTFGYAETHFPGITPD